MRLIELRLNHFGKFHNKVIKLENGVNLVYGENEAGKSTIHTFVRGMLFGIEKLRGRASRDDTYLKYLPWDTPGAYSGSMDIEIAGKQYRLIRNFDKNIKGFQLIDLKTGRELTFRPEELRELYGGLTETGYRNTISIGQLKSKTDHELAEELRNYIANLSLSKNNEVDVTKALGLLQEKRKELEAMRTEARLAELEEEISQGLDYDLKMEALSGRLNEIELQEKILRENAGTAACALEGADGFSSAEEYRSFLEHFPVIKEKYRIYCDNLKERDILDKKLASLQNSLADHERNREEYSRIKNLNAHLETLKSSASELEDRKEQLRRGTGSQAKDSGRKRQLLCLLPVLAGIAGFFVFAGKSIPAAGIFSVIALAGIGAFVTITRRIHKKLLSVEQECREYDNRIRTLQAEIGGILLQNKVSDEHELRRKQEELLAGSLSADHMRVQEKEYQEQLSIHEGKLNIWKEEILDYIRQCPFISGVNHYGDHALNDTVMETLEEYIRHRKEQAARKQAEAAKEYEACRLAMEKLKWELNMLEEKRTAAEEKLLADKELQKELLRQKHENEQELAALKLAAQTINNLSSEIHDSFGGKLNRLVSDMAGNVTDGRYDDIKLDEKLNIKAGHGDNYVLSDKLSAGTIEQLYLALRIGVADMVYGEGNMPILLDDCLALYDDNRARAALTALTGGNKRQVILFTCHKREKEILDGLKVKYQYIDLSAE